MNKLKIHSPSIWNFSFEMDNKEEISEENWHCSCHYCRVICLNPVYVLIINSLKEAGLLDENYKPICCFCAVLKEFGLLDIKDHLSQIIYDNISDTLTIRFLFVMRGDQYFVYFYVHDYSKLNHYN